LDVLVSFHHRAHDGCRLRGDFSQKLVLFCIFLLFREEEEEEQQQR
jgi:hypothetical protein